MKLLLRQLWTLVWKDLLLILNRERLSSTLFRAVTIPVVFAFYISVVLRVYWPREGYGVGSPRTVRTLAEGLNAATGGRNTLALVNTGHSGGDIDKVIQIIAAEARPTGKTVELLSDEDDLIELCRSTLRGSTRCYGAAIFYSSPTEGDAGYWNYTLRADGGFFRNIFVNKDDNPSQVYLIPLQHAIDSAIAKVNGSAQLPSTSQEYPYTSKTQKEWKDSITTSIQWAIAKYLSVVWLIGFIGVTYQLVGIVAAERESGMADLIESMMPNRRRWERQFARFVGHYLAFVVVWGPSWIVMGLIMKIGIYPYASVGIILLFNILAGLAFISFSLLGAAFFRKAQLSGITVVLVALALGIAAQVLTKTLASATVVVLGALFTPMTFVFFMVWLSRFEHKQIPANLVKGAPEDWWEVPGIVFWACLIIQICVYPVLAAMVERWLYGQTSTGRDVSYNNPEMAAPVRIYQALSTQLVPTTCGPHFPHQHSGRTRGG